MRHPAGPLDSFFIAGPFVILMTVLSFQGCLVIGGKSKAPSAAELCPPCPQCDEQAQAKAAFVDECGNVWLAKYLSTPGNLSPETRTRLDEAERQCMQKLKGVQ